MKIRDLLKYIEPDHQFTLTATESSLEGNIRFRLSCPCGWRSTYVMTRNEADYFLGTPGLPEPVLCWEENEALNHLLDQEVDDLAVLEALK